MSKKLEAEEITRIKLKLHVKLSIFDNKALS